MTDNIFAELSENSITASSIAYEKINVVSKTKVNDKELLESLNAVITDINDTVDFYFSISYGYGMPIITLKVEVYFKEDKENPESRVMYNIKDDDNILITVYNSDNKYDTKTVCHLHKIIDYEGKTFYIQPVLDMYNTPFVRYITMNLYVE
jgi:hypothetical protein